ncbi:MAG: RNA 2',3'-cyclic phosphodiesterase [Bryobacteraceae bacterium]
MRLFVGIGLPEAVSDALFALLTRLRPAASVKWSPIGNLHITTKLIGEWPEDRLEEMTAALQGVERLSEPLAIEVRGLGWFPNPHHPRVFWAGVHSAGLAGLAQATDRQTTQLGAPAEERAYSPHLTLARIKDPVPLAPLRQAVASLDSTEFGRFTASAFSLYHSKTGSSGAVYIRLAEFSLI